MPNELPVAIVTECTGYLGERISLLERQLETINNMADADSLPDAVITESGLKITPLDAAVPEAAQALIDQAAKMLHPIEAAREPERSLVTVVAPHTRDLV